MSSSETAKNYHPNIQVVPVEGLVEWANEYALKNNAAKDALTLFLERRPDLANDPRIVAKIGATAATGKMIDDLHVMIQFSLEEQQGAVDTELEALLAEVAGDDITPQA